eukprot:scaffold33875_cov27-Tisochrysis_lutea.AAC.4
MARQAHSQLCTGEGTPSEPHLRHAKSGYAMRERSAAKAFATRRPPSCCQGPPVRFRAASATRYPDPRCLRASYRAIGAIVGRLRAALRDGPRRAPHGPPKILRVLVPAQLR